MKLQVTSWWRALLVAVASLVGCWLLLWSLWRRGVYLPLVDPLVAGVEGLLALVIIGLGWRVRRFLAGKNPRLKALAAARTFVLAQAASYCGATLAGWYGSQVAEAATELGHLGAKPIINAAIALGGAVALLVAGMVVERWCRVPPMTGLGDCEDTDPSGSVSAA